MEETPAEVTFRPTGTENLEATKLAPVKAIEAISGDPVRLPPWHKGQRNFPGLFWAAAWRAELLPTWPIGSIARLGSRLDSVLHMDGWGYEPPK